MWVLVAGLFAFSAVSKIARGGFAEWLGRTGMVPPQAARPLAALAPVLELAVVFLLAHPRLRIWGWRLVAGLGSVFAVVHVALALLGDIEACGCLGLRLSRNALWDHLLMTGLCLGLVAAAGLAHRGRAKGPPEEVLRCPETSS